MEGVYWKEKRRKGEARKCKGKLARLAKKQQKAEEACEKKKNKINKNLKLRRKRCQIETDSKDDQLTADELCYCESNEDELDAFSDLDENLNSNKDDFVIVKYDNYFPGQIRELKEGDVKEYYVSTMQRSGPKGWKWSEENKDVTWYLEKNVIQRIKPPSITNSRGVCRVPEVEQYNK